jgi:hypothetical protein
VKSFSWFPRLLALALLLVAPTASFAVAVAFPPGVDWNNATPEQIRRAVYDAVKADPNSAIEIVSSSINSVAQTGRFPRAGETDGKQVLDPGVDTFEEVSDQIGDAAAEANPEMAAQIAEAVNSAVGGTTTDTSSGGGGGGGGGVPPPLPGGFGGGGGGTSGGGTSSDGGGSSGGGGIYSG